MKIPADFDAEIWSVVAEIPAGRVATYGQLARLIGMPGHARRAGRALALAPEKMEAGDFLRLVLNALYFLGKGKLPAAQIKAIVEMRMLSLAGFMPDLVCCAQCGAYEADQMYFMVKQGSLYCGSCYPQFAPGGVLMNRGVTTALRHTIYADFNKVFSFTLPAKDLEALAKASERYLLNTVERGFATLDFYKQICVPSSPDT